MAALPALIAPTVTIAVSCGSILRDDGLQAHHYGGADYYRIDRVLRHCTVAALAVQGNGDRIGRAHEGAAGKTQLADREAGNVMHAEYGITREAFEQSVLNHHSGAAATFFRRLENQVQGAGKRRVLCQIARGRQQHGGVAVMTAGVHHAAVGAGIGQSGDFFNGQRVHVGTQAERFPRAALQSGDNAGLSYMARNPITPLGQQLCHQIAGGEFIESQFGVSVDMAANGDHFVLNSGYFR